MNAFVESGVGALERIAGHGADHVGGVDQSLGRQQRESSHRQHGLGTVDERDRFFGLEHQRFDACSLERFCASDAAALAVMAFAFSDQKQSQVGQGREIAGGAHAPLRRHPGGDAPREQFADRVNSSRPHAGIALGKRIGAQQHHGPGFCDGERVADAHRVRTHQVDLQFADLIAGDAYIAKFADAGGDGVGHLVVGDERVDDGARSVHALARIRSQ